MSIEFHEPSNQLAMELRQIRLRERRIAQIERQMARAVMLSRIGVRPYGQASLLTREIIVPTILMLTECGLLLYLLAA